MMRRLLLALALVFAVSPAHAADQTVLGKDLTVKNPGPPERRMVTIKAKESSSDNTLVGDPVANGASLTVTLTGVTSSSDTYALPAGNSVANGKPFWTGDAVKGFKYRDAKGENGPVKSAELKSKGGTFQIKIAVDGRLGAVSLVPPGPGAGCAMLTVAGGDSYSVRFADGQVTTTGDSYFKIAKPVSEGSCIEPTTTTTSTSTTTTTLPPIPFRVPPGAAPLRYRDLVFANATVTSNVVYGSAVNASGQTVTLLLDVYEPTGDAVPERPAIIWIHGGSFATGSKTSPELVDQATTFARKGYLNVSITYRLEPPGCSAGGVTPTCITAIVEAQQDAQTAVQYLRANAATYGIDTTRIAISGTSAGAITALNVGFASSENPAASVAAAVSLSGARIGPAIDAGDAPSLLFHGTSDFVVPYTWATGTVNAATAAGLDSFLTTWPGAGHVPYVAHRTEIIDQTTNFLYWEMDLTNADQ
jgi:predicted esterase